MPVAASEIESESVPEHIVNALTGKSVLLVDDDTRNVFALTSALEQFGLVVIQAYNGKDGIEKLQRTPSADVVLMDVMMPKQDGFDTMMLIRQIDKYRTMPVIALTAKAMPGDREKCVQAGATDDIAKPVKLCDLMAVLWRNLPHLEVADGVRQTG